MSKVRGLLHTFCHENGGRAKGSRSGRVEGRNWAGSNPTEERLKLEPSSSRVLGSDHSAAKERMRRLPGVLLTLEKYRSNRR